MKCFIVLLSLIGSGFALAPGKEYTYSYTGRLGMGIPEIKNTVSGMGFKSDIIVQVQEQNRVVFQMTNIQVGEYVGNTYCVNCAPLPIAYSPLQGHAKILEQPFEVHFNNDKDQVMVLPKTDLEWIINLRKAVAVIFLIRPLRSTSSLTLSHVVSSTNETFPRAFTAIEPTLFGTCLCHYTAVPLVSAIDQMEKEEHLKKMKEDIEPNKKSETLYRIIRSVNFNLCQDRVELFRAGIGNFSKLTHGQFGDITSRSSVATFYLIGTPGNFRVQSGLIEGVISANPLGIRDAKLISFSNQTINLVSVGNIQKPISLTGPSKTIKTWFMEFASPFAPPTNPVPWINYYSSAGAATAPYIQENIVTGIPITDNDIKNYMTLLDMGIEEISQKLTVLGSIPKEGINPWDSNEALIMSQLHEMSKVVMGVDVPRLQQLFDKYNNDKSENGILKCILLIEIAASSGSGAPLKMLLNNFRNQTISNFRIISTFVSLTNHFTAVPLIPEITDYAKNLTLKENPFLTTMVWLNYAKILNRVCINAESPKYTTPNYIFGKEQCDQQQVTNDIINFFNNQLNASSEDWERMVVLRALSNLGTNRTLQIFKDVIYNDKFGITVKRPAIYALASYNMDSSVENEVFELLMPIVENSQVETYLREISILTLLTWNPSPSWWQRLALRSWKEPNNLAAFIYQVMTDFAETADPNFEKESRIAQFVLPLTKPFPRSSKYSVNYFRGYKDGHQQLGIEFIIRILKDERVRFPLEIVDAFSSNFGGVKFLLFKFALFTDLMEQELKTREEPIGKIQNPKNPKPNDSHNATQNASSGNKQDQDKVESLVKHVESLKPKIYEHEVDIFFNILDNMQILLPLNMDTILGAYGKGGSEIIASWLSERRIHLTKFFDPSSLEVFLPTETGLPFFLRFCSPVLYVGEGETQMRVPGSSRPSITEIFENSALHVKGNFKHASKFIVTFRVPLPWNEKLVAAGVETFKAVIVPGNLAFGFNNLHNSVKNYTFNFQPTTTPYAPFHAHTVPFVVLKSMWPGQPHSKYEKFEMVTYREDERGLTKKFVKFDEANLGINGFFSYEGDTPLPFTLGNVIEFFRNPTLVNKLISTRSVKLSSSVIAVNFEDSETKKVQVSLARASPNHENKDYGFDTRVLLEGYKSNRYYEFLWRKKWENSESDDLTMTLYRNAIPRHHIKSSCYSYRMLTTYPAIYDFDTLEQNLRRKDLGIQYSGVLKGGEHCNEDQLANIKGELTLSPERRRNLAKELQQDECNCDPSNKMLRFKTAPVYDQLLLRVDYKEHLPTFIRNFTCHIYDFIRGVTYPHAYFNYVGVKNHPRTITVTGERPIYGKWWHIRTEMPTENAIFENFNFPLGYTHIIPTTSFVPPPYEHSEHGGHYVMLDTQVSSKCILTKNEVRTFDGYRYKYSPEPCPTVSVMQRDHPEVVLLRTDKSKNGNMEAQIGEPKTGMTLTFSTTFFSVNGDNLELKESKSVIKTYQNAYFAEARRTKDYVEVIIPGNFSIKLWNDKIEVEPDSAMHGKYTGLCGDFNGETQHELVGPQRCIYKDPSLYTKAWTQYEGVGCEWRHFLNERNEVESFQKLCHKSDGSNSPFQNETHPDGEHKDCTQYVYLIRSRGGNICVSQQSIGQCVSGCRLHRPVIYKEVYDCWPEDQTPEVLRKSLEKGYVDVKIRNAPTVITSFRTVHALICVKS